mmetsp:Transcript_32223/g.91398  ORF Transcript_32223/g.91398 Transcript_32223/m.91398 type:complete len:368 (+) Transcript_32223:484-1587(+)
MKFATRLKSLSAYARAEEHLVKQTYFGAVVTITGCCIALLLFLHELQYYWTPFTHTEMYVDKIRREKLRITLNITFPSLPCEVLSLDAVDAAGKRESDVLRGGDVEIHKFRLDREGGLLDSAEYAPPAVVKIIETPAGVLLNGQAKQDQEAIDKAMEDMQGCNIYGHLDVMRVAGNFHISVHSDNFFHMKNTQREILDAIRRFQHSMEHGGIVNLNSLQVVHDTTRINVSHYIHEMRFGPEYPGKVNPLDGFRRLVDHDSGTFKYFLKVVPTEYHPLRGPVMKTNQYSVHEYYHDIGHSDGLLPAVYFMYDLSPIAVKISERRKSLAHFLVQVCAVVGGAFAVTGMVDRWVHWLVMLSQQAGSARGP